MLGPGAGGLRLLRALVFLSVTVSLTVGGHAVAGGPASVVGVVAVAALTWPIAILGSRRERGVRHLFPVLVAGQVAGHAVLTFFAGSGALPVTCATSLGHHGSVGDGCGGPVPAVLTGHPHASASMAWAHLAAALVLAVVLARGEALLWRVVDLVVPVVPTLARPVVDVVRAAFGVRRLRRRHLVLLVPGRGPPVPA